MTAEPVRAEAVIAALRARARQSCARGIRALSLFGSVVRGEAGPESDVDLAAELDPAAEISLIELVALERRPGEVLGRHVDLLPEPVEKARRRANLERDRGRAV